MKIIAGLPARQYFREYYRNHKKGTLKYKRYLRRHRKQRLAQQKKHYHENFESVAAYSRNYYINNRERLLERIRMYRSGRHGKMMMRANHLKRKYNLSLEEYRAMVKKLKGRCPSCKRKIKLYVDHDHKTGKVRGLLCRKCNLSIGYIGDDLKVLKRLVKYLENSLRRTGS